MKKRIVLDCADGKTIETSIHSWGSKILISFTDDTFIILGIDRGYHDGEEEITDKEFKLGDFNDDDLIEARIFSATGLANARESKRNRNKTLAEIAERATYERLKAKYEE